MTTEVETLRTPGADGTLGNSDDALTPLDNFQREISITDLLRDGSTEINPSLRQITVTIRYTVQGMTRDLQHHDLCVVLLMKIFHRLIRERRVEAGYSLAEMVISMGIMTAVMGATASVMNQAARANESAVLVSGLNNSLRTGMDLMIRDLLQVGSGLPPGHVVLVPSGANALQMNIPGPPSTAYQTASGDLDWAAVIPGDRAGACHQWCGDRHRHRC